MNEERRLILYSLKWLIERDSFTPELRKKMNNDICNKIVEILHPQKEQSQASKTEFAFSEEVGE